MCKFCRALNIKKHLTWSLLVMVFIFLFMWTTQELVKHSLVSFRNKAGKLHRANTVVPSHPEQLLFIFTTWTHKKDKVLVHQKVLETWRTLMPAIQPGVFSNEADILKKARDFGWKAHNVSEMECGGIPTLRSMFLAAGKMYSNSYPLYGFSNADILFDQSLVESIRHVANMFRQTIQTKPVLILVKRVNVDSQRVFSGNTSDLSKVIKTGRYPGEGSSDLFVTNSKFPWNKVPALVVGRVGFGMWLVAFARASGVTVIDITQTTRAVHLTTNAGNFESSVSKRYMCNHKLMRQLKLYPKSFSCGWIECAQYHTEFEKSGRVQINFSKIPDWCHKCNSSQHV